MISFPSGSAQVRHVWPVRSVYNVLILTRLIRLSRDSLTLPESSHQSLKLSSAAQRLTEAF